MRSINKTTARVLLALCLIILGAVAGNYVYGTPQNHPQHECRDGKHCQNVYMHNHGSCTNTGYPDRLSTRDYQWFKCRPQEGRNCHEYTPTFTWCFDASCGYWNGTSWDPDPNSPTCDYWLGRCSQ